MLFWREDTKLSFKKPLHNISITLWVIHDPYGQCPKIGPFSVPVLLSDCSLLSLGNNFLDTYFYWEMSLVHNKVIKTLNYNNHFTSEWKKELTDPLLHNAV